MTARIATALRLGRVSNVPTVWTNVLAGLAVAGGGLSLGLVVPLGLALSLFYVGGMYLNDAFDARWDAEHRRERPIPAGLVSARTVFVAGFAQLGAGLLLIAAFTPGRTLVPAMGLVAAIVLYDVSHKNNPLSPVLMGLCRVGVYLTAAIAVTPSPSASVWRAAALLLGYLIGLSFVAKQEIKPRLDRLWPLAFLLPAVMYGPWLVVSGDPARMLLVPSGLLLGWTASALSYLRGLRARPDVPRAVVSLIAGIALFDAVLLAATGHTAGLFVAIALFALTLSLQRHVPGT